MFRATNITPEDAYRTVKRAATGLQANLVGVNARLQASGADYDFLRSIYSLLFNVNAQFDTLKTTPGLAEHAKTAEDDPTYDVVTEFLAMQAAITSAIGWMDANVPTNVTSKFPADWGEGTLIADTFTPGQTSGLRTQLTGVINTIV